MLPTQQCCQEMGTEHRVDLCQQRRPMLFGPTLRLLTAPTANAGVGLISLTGAVRGGGDIWAHSATAFQWLHFSSHSVRAQLWVLLSAGEYMLCRHVVHC
jgi:hypothetical protein